MNNSVTKLISIKVPYKLIWTLAVITGLAGSTVSWWSEKLPDILYWVVFFPGISLTIYVLYLFYKFYNRKSLKQIIVNTDGNIVFVYQLLRQGTSQTHNYRPRKKHTKTVVKGSIMNLLENNIPIAKIYRNTLENKDDWKWLIDYFEN